MEPQENPKSEKEIVVYNGVFFALSETFIFRQIEVLSQFFAVSLLTRVLENPNTFNIGSITAIELGYYFNTFDRVVSAFQRKVLRKEMIFSRFQDKFLKEFFADRRGHAMVHAHFGWSGLEILPFVKRNYIPLVVSFHGRDASGELNNLAYRNNLSKLFDYASAIILCSHDMKDRLNLENYQEKTYVVPYGVDVDFFTPKPMKVFSNGEIRILHVGRLTPKKGVPDLIKVFAEISRVRDNLYMDIVGEGEEMDVCRELVEGLDLHHKVVLHGGKDQAIVREMINNCDIFVLNSRTADNGDMEGFPNVILEAMSMGKPVVSTKHAAIPDAVIDRETGLLVNERDSKGLKNAILDLVNNNEKRQNMGISGRRRVVEKYSVGVMQQKLKKIFEEIPIE